MTKTKIEHTAECIARQKSGKGGCWCHLPSVQKLIAERKAEKA